MHARASTRSSKNARRAGIDKRCGFRYAPEKFRDTHMGYECARFAHKPSPTPGMYCPDKKGSYIRDARKARHWRVFLCFLERARGARVE
jgi:hypothetical protein